MMLWNIWQRKLPALKRVHDALQGVISTPLFGIRLRPTLRFGLRIPVSYSPFHSLSLLPTSELLLSSGYMPPVYCNCPPSQTFISMRPLLHFILNVKQMRKRRPWTCHTKQWPTLNKSLIKMNLIT